jgi:hypothetical protein
MQIILVANSKILKARELREMGEKESYRKVMINTNDTTICFSRSGSKEHTPR